MRMVYTELSLADNVLAVSEIYEQVSRGPFEAVFDADHFESFARFGMLCVEQFLEERDYLVSCVSGGLASQEVIDEEAELLTGYFGAVFVF